MSGFTLQHNGACTSPGRGRPAGACEALLGDAFVQARRVEASAGNVSLEGYAVRPATRERHGAQYLFVNGRFVRDRMLAHALRERTATCCITTASRRMRCG
jgi:DNA mismatch repair protein MutL